MVNDSSPAATPDRFCLGDRALRDPGKSARSIRPSCADFLTDFLPYNKRDADVRCLQ
jgi:hypothetical protein